MTNSIKRVNRDSDRMKVKEFFAEHLNDDSGLDMLTVAEDRQLGIMSTIQTVTLDDKLIAASFYSNSPQDIAHFEMHGRKDIADAIRSNMMMLHSIAVHPLFRKRGIGAKLINKAIEDAQVQKNASLVMIFKDENGLGEFYEKMGFMISDDIIIQFHGITNPMTLPQTDKSYKWAYLIFDPATMRIVDKVEFEKGR